MAIDKKISKGGRPSKYQDEFAKQAYSLCLLGATNQQLADFFEVNVDTIHQWIKKHKRFSDAVRGSKIYADAQVAEALFKRAKGYMFEEVTFEKIDTPDTLKSADIKTELYRKKVVVKHLAPDAGAALNWLKNRQGAFWRDRQEIAFENMTDDQLDSIIAKLTTQTQGNDTATKD